MNTQFGAEVNGNDHPKDRIQQKTQRQRYDWDDNGYNQGCPKWYLARCNRSILLDRVLTILFNINQVIDQIDSSGNQAEEDEAYRRSQKRFQLEQLDIKD